MKLGNVIVGQSGGPTSVINSSLAGVFKTAKDLGAKKIYGMRNGIEGLLNETYIDMSEYIKGDLEVELLNRTPSAYLGSCRFKLPTVDKSPETYDKIIAILRKLDIQHFFYIGGNVHKEVLDFLGQKAHFTWSYRDFPHDTHPNITPGDKPIVVLVNERSLSDAEVTSNGIKALGIAKIIGTETYRWIIFTSSVGFIDGSSIRMPAWGCYSLDGKDLEFTGVKPDIYVKNTFKDRLDGKDPQLERAIREVLEQLR